MSYRPKKAVLDGITVRRRTRNGVVQTVYDAYLGYDPFDRKQKRLQASSLDELKEKIHQFYVTHQSGGDAAVRLKPTEAIDARQALDLLAQAKAGVSLTEAVKRFLRGDGMAVAPQCTKTLGEAYDAYYASFGKEQTLHKKAVFYRVGAWVEDFGRDRMLSDATSKDIDAWLKKKCAKSAKTFNNHLTYIKTFFNWCMKRPRTWIADNPADGMDKQRIAYKEPEYMAPGDVERVFRELERRKADRPDLLAYGILSFFCGVRREEILRMATMPDAATVNIEDETVIIRKPKGWTKGITPRSFPIQGNALAWMKSFPFEDSVRRIGDHCADDVKEIAGKLKIAMPKNAGRHTFITMHVAAFGNPTNTDAIVGTSARMRVSNYCGLVSKKSGEEYFAIMPATEEARNEQAA